MTSSIPLKLRPLVHHAEKPVALSEAARAHDLKERGGPAGKILLVTGEA